MIAYAQQLERWKGEMGDAYFAHPMNEWTLHSKRSRRLFWLGDGPHRLGMLQRLHNYPPHDLHSILEIGCGDGQNLHAIGPDGYDLRGAEPNPGARKRASAIPWVGEVYEADAIAAEAIPGAFDLVFTRAALITIPDDGLGNALRIIAGLSQRFVLLVEYFQPQPIRYEIDGKWTFYGRDYGALALVHYSDLRPLEAGFLWHASTGLNNLSWWLFEKQEEENGTR